MPGNTYNLYIFRKMKPNNYLSLALCVRYMQLNTAVFSIILKFHLSVANVNYCFWTYYCTCDYQNRLILFLLEQIIL